jgi:rRNA-processing protein FCF1
MALDVSRLGFSTLSDDVDTLEALRSGRVRHTRDALIAYTALSELCALVTNDGRLAARARDQGIEVLTTKELLVHCGFNTPAAPETSESMVP